MLRGPINRFWIALVPLARFACSQGRSPHQLELLVHGEGWSSRLCRRWGGRCGPCLGRGLSHVELGGWSLLLCLGVWKDSCQGVSLVSIFRPSFFSLCLAPSSASKKGLRLWAMLSPYKKRHSLLILETPDVLKLLVPLWEMHSWVLH